MEYIVDSGMGATNIINFLTQLNPTHNLKPLILNTHISELENNEIVELFNDSIHEFYRDRGKIFMGCNSLNSVFRDYKGAYNLLTEYLYKSDKKNIVIGTYKTIKSLKKDIPKKNLNKTILIPLDLSFVELIDLGFKPSFKINVDGFDNLILGCTHYDNLSIKTKHNIISTSELCAIELNKIIKEV